MTKNLFAVVAQKSQQSPWLPVLSVLISLFGIVFLEWDFQYLIILFVWEVVLMLAFALIRMIFAMNAQAFFKTILEKLFYLGLGVFIGGFFLVFSVMFMTESIQTDIFFAEIRKISDQIYLLTFGYITSLVLNYFGTGKYKDAVPMFEMAPFIHVLVILAVLQGFTGHLLPSFPHLDQALWGVVALVLVKFFVDLLFAFLQNPFIFAVSRRRS